MPLLPLNLDIIWGTLGYERAACARDYVDQTSAQTRARMLAPEEAPILMGGL